MCIRDSYKADFAHISGYVLWTIYQQFLLQDYFMDRLLRLLSNESAALTLAGVLFAAAHLPNLVLTAATLVWGIVSCALFRRYRNLWALGLAQGLLGLCFAVCVPDALHHHLRVGLGLSLIHICDPNFVFHVHRGSAQHGSLRRLRLRGGRPLAHHPQ